MNREQILEKRKVLENWELSLFQREEKLAEERADLENEEKRMQKSCPHKNIVNYERSSQCMDCYKTFTRKIS